MQNWLQEKHYNVRSISIRPITDGHTQNFSCSCLMCTSYPTKKQNQLLQTQEKMIDNDLKLKIAKKYAESHLETIVKGIIIPNNKICKRAVEVYIPQICFLQDGEPTGLYYVKETQHKNGEEKKDVAIVKMKKEKINGTVLQKVLHQHRRTYRDRLRKKLQLQNLKREPSIRKDQRNSKGIIFSKGQSLTVAVVRYTDGCQTLISETELLFLLQKRKTDPAWKKISYIRNYIAPLSNYSNPNPEKSPYHDIKYQHSTPRFVALWNRAVQLMQTYNTKLHPSQRQYISDQQQSSFCQSLKQQSDQCFAYYTFYKIAAFLAEFSDEQIERASAKMFINQIGQCYLLQVKDLVLKPLLKYNFTHEIYQKMTQQRQQNKYHKKQLQTNSKIIQKSQLIQSLMKEQYQELKIKYGITVEPKVDINQKLNNQFFAFLHPNLNDKLSELIKLDIPLSTFKRKVLGQKVERKPLFRPFNSRFVRDLHQLTPQKSCRHSRNLSVTLSNRKQEGQLFIQTARTPWKFRHSHKLAQTIAN